MTVQPDDDTLMTLYRDGDEAAFHTLFDRYRGLVYHLARVMLGDGGVAEEVMQETFLAVARDAARYESKGYFRTWLLRIVRNRCLNLMESRRFRRSVFDELRIVPASLPEAISPEPTPAEHMQASERLSLVNQAIQKLPERQREAIMLYAFDSMTYQDIARALEIPTNTVKTLIHRARATLARTIETAEEGGP